MRKTFQVPLEKGDKIQETENTLFINEKLARKIWKEVASYIGRQARMKETKEERVKRATHASHSRKK